MLESLKFHDIISASILEGPEQAYAYALSKGNEAWIGLEWNDGEGAYQWSDNWPVWFTQWGEGYPNDDQKNTCVSLKENQDAQQSEWVQANCAEKKVKNKNKLKVIEHISVLHLHGTRA